MNQLYRLVRYNYVSVTLYWLTSRVNLSLSVSLNKTNKDGTTKFCYLEKPSNSGGLNAYLDLVWNLKLKDIYNQSTDGAFTITNRNFYQFICTMRTMKLWLTEAKHNNLFMMDKVNKIFRCNSNYKPLVTINQYNEKLEVTPSIMVTDVGDHTPGVQIFINSGESNAFLTTQDFLNFELFLSDLNPTMLSMQLLSMFNGGHVDDANDSSVQKQQAAKSKSNQQGFLSLAGATRRDDS